MPYIAFEAKTWEHLLSSDGVDGVESLLNCVLKKDGENTKTEFHIGL